jgi:two-component system phosphate regulon sensor histidine kinase PhoR
VPLFETRGLWAEAFARVDKLRAKARNRKKKYHRLLREVRESTGALADGGIILNADNEIMWFNPAAARLLGLNPATDIGHRIDNLLRHPDFAAYLKAPTGDGITVASPRNDAGWLQVQIIPYGTDQRLAIIRDVTNEKNVERTRRDFVANASHELRTPLAAIQGFAETLLGNPSLGETDRRGYLEVIDRHAKRLGAIVTDLLELSNIESRETRFELAAVDTEKLAETLLRDSGPRCEQKELKVSLTSDRPGIAWANPQACEQILSNLLDNAIKYTEPGGRITLRIGGDERNVRIAVSDTGVGIPERDLARIFERFYRVDQARSRSQGGTGLGLAIVKHLVQSLGGAIQVESQLGRGSTFSFTLPRHEI